MNLGPALSLSNEDLDSYGNAKDLTAKQGRAAVEGFKQCGVAAVPTGFPDDEVILKDESPLYTTRLHPLSSVIKHASERMPTTDATQTAKTLRNKLEFDGLIIQDCTIQPPTLNQLLQAIKAGADMILISLPYKEQMQAMEFIKHAL